MNNKFLFPLLSALCSAAMLLFSEVITVQYAVSPLLMSAILNVCGGLLFFFFVKNKKQSVQQILHAHPFLFIGASLCSYTLSLLTAFYAVSHLGGSRISFALQYETVFIVIIAYFFLREQLSLKAVCSALLILTGGVLLQYNYGMFVFGFSDFLAILSPFFFSVGIILTTLLVKEYSTLTITAGGQLLGGIILFCIVPFVSVQFPSKVAFGLIIIMSACEALAWQFYNKGLSIAGASTTSILFGTVPFFTLLFSFVFNKMIKDVFIIPQNLLFIIAGGIIMFCGIILMYSEKDKQSNP